MKLALLNFQNDQLFNSVVSLNVKRFSHAGYVEGTCRYGFLIWKTFYLSPDKNLSALYWI